MCAHTSSISKREGRKLTATTIDTGYAWTTQRNDGLVGRVTVVLSWISTGGHTRLHQTVPHLRSHGCSGQNQQTTTQNKKTGIWGKAHRGLGMLAELGGGKRALGRSNQQSECNVDLCGIAKERALKRFFSFFKEIKIRELESCF